MQSINMTDDEKFRYEERAAICEYEGNLNRADAERIALQEVLDERKHPLPPLKRGGKNQKND